jgi:hypothetical protein
VRSVATLIGVTKPETSLATYGPPVRYYGQGNRCGADLDRRARPDARHVGPAASTVTAGTLADRRVNGLASGEQREAAGGDPFDLAADIAEILPGHRPGLHPPRDPLRDHGGLEVG